MSRPKAPPTQILPQSWKNPKIAPAKLPGVVYPEPQEEAPIPLVAPVAPDLAPHVYVPVDPEPAERTPEPEVAPGAPAAPFAVPFIPPHPNAR